MKFNYNHKKNAKLLAERGIGFEEIIQAIVDGNLLDIKLHHNQQCYPGQYLLYIKVVDEVYVTPCVKEDKGTIFLKTLFPSRKAKKELLAIDRKLKITKKTDLKKNECV